MLGGSRLWHHSDFLKLWAGQTISVIGGEITVLALPTLAILQFHTSALVVGLLIATQRLPFLVLTLFTGVLADRVRRRPLMIVADAGRAIALASIPLAFLLNALTLAQLFVIALCMGIGNVLFDIAYLAYLPSLVGQADILEGNNKLNTSFSIALLAGPGLGGVLVQAIGAARTIGINALSYVVSVLTLLWIREPEPHPRKGGEQSSVMTELREGIGVVFRHPLLRSLLAMMTSLSVAEQLAIPLYLVFFYRQLHLTPAEAGLIFASFGLGALVGSLLASRAVATLGLGRAMLVGATGSPVGLALVPLALLLPPVPWLFFTNFVAAVAITVMDLQQVSLRQSLTPSHLQGRMNATYRTVFWGVWPLANFAGGFLGDRIGFVPTFLIAAAVGLVPVGIVLASPIGRLRSYPAGADAADPGQTREPDPLGLRPEV
jgi:MFS family permease